VKKGRRGEKGKEREREREGEGEEGDRAGRRRRRIGMRSFWFDEVRNNVQWL